MRCVLRLLFGLLMFVENSAHAQPLDEVAESLGLSAERNALPVWANAPEDAKRELGGFVRSNNQAVMIIGNPRAGHGTGFVISKSNRLVATNAHVADIAHRAGKIVAITNGTAQVYAVEKAWYHPGVKRKLRGERSLVVRSTDPSDGPVDPTSPDLAVLQLGANGTELPKEVQLARQKDLDELFGQPVGLMGFPGHDNRSWPAIGSEAAATYHDGVVSRLTDFNLNGGAARGTKQFVQYTMSTWGGFSGSPVFLPSGRVVAIHNMARYHQGPAGNVKSIAHGVRVDCLFELLYHHRLDDKVTIPVDRSSLDIARWLVPDDAGDRYRRAIALCAEANRLVFDRKYKDAVAKAREAMKLAPYYPVPYLIRSNGYAMYVFDNHRRIAKSLSLDQLGYARRDALKYIQLAPADPAGVLHMTTVMNNTTYLTQDKDEMRKVLTIANRLLSGENLSHSFRAQVHSARAVAYSNLQQGKSALAEHNEALRLDPNNPDLWETRADYWRNAGNTSLYQSDMKRVRELRNKIRQGNS